MWKLSSLENGFPSKKIWQKKLFRSDSEGWKLTLHSKNKKCEWYVDNDYSKHMTRDKVKVLNLKEERGGNAYFGEMVQPRS